MTSTTDSIVPARDPISPRASAAEAISPVAGRLTELVPPQERRCGRAPGIGVPRVAIGPLRIAEEGWCCSQSAICQRAPTTSGRQPPAGANHQRAPSLDCLRERHCTRPRAAPGSAAARVCRRRARSRGSGSLRARSARARTARVRHPTTPPPSFSGRWEAPAQCVRRRLR